jgi:hypothetical protein
LADGSVITVVAREDDETFEDPYARSCGRGRL